MNDRKIEYKHTADKDIKSTITDVAAGVQQILEEDFPPGTNLLIASAQGDLALATQMLVEGSDPNSADTSKTTCLLIASQQGHLDIVKLLLKYHANPDLTNDELYSPLHVACRAGHADIVSALLAAHPKLNVLNKGIVTPLLCAVLANDIIIVDMLLKAGALLDVEGQQFEPSAVAHDMQQHHIFYLLRAHSAIQKLKETNDKYKTKEMTVTCLDETGSLYRDGKVRMLFRRNSDGSLKTAEELQQKESVMHSLKNP